MKEMTASEASRNFSAVLDEAERGETIVVTRNSKRIALITPAPRANGSALRTVFQRWNDNAALDGTFEARVAEAREISDTELDEDPWRD
jgi:prevent-host-death family protein